MRRRNAIAAVAAGGLLLLASVAGFAAVGTDGTDAAGSPAAAQQQAAVVDPLTTAITAAQQRLETVPGDWTTWAQLGSAYVEQARVTADPSFYDLADGALARSLELRPVDNDVALTGQGALANARHDFTAARDAADAALAVNPYSATAWGVLTDARTQLGDYPGATQALDRMLALRPGLASFTRASYDAELHGDRAAARSALEQALETTTGDPAGAAFCRTYLGQLAFSQGDLDEAGSQFSAGLATLPDDAPLLLGQARVDAARGDTDAAVAGFARVVDASPLPEHLVEYGEYLESLGRADQAQQQFALVDTVRQLFAARGVTDDLSAALFAADHGDPATALTAAQAEYDRRQNVDSQDALAWALHAAGRDDEALPLAQQATSLGGPSALALYHRGAIEASLGLTDQARATLTRALDLNPHVSPLLAPRATDLLDSLGGPA